MKNIIFIVVFGILCTVAVCVSQTLDRTSVPHYLCLLSALLSMSGATYFTLKMEAKSYE